MIGDRSIAQGRKSYCIDHEAVRGISKSLPQGNPHEYMLAPKRVKGKARQRYDFIKQFQTHVNGACTIHDMRRSFPSNLVSAAVSIYKIAQWLGDRVEVVERSYGYLAPAEDDVNKLW